MPQLLLCCCVYDTVFYLISAVVVRFAAVFKKQVAMLNAGASIGFFRGDPTLLVEDMQVQNKTKQILFFLLELNRRASF